MTSGYVSSPVDLDALLMHPFSIQFALILMVHTIEQGF